MRKQTSRIIRALCAGLGLTLVLPVVACRGWVSDKPPVHLNPNMDTQHKLKPYRASDFFADGQGMRMPVEGTVARTVPGNLPRDAELLAEDDHRYRGKNGAAFAVGFPADFQASAADMKRGQQRYNIYCAPCHGKAGDGNGTVARFFVGREPPSFHQQRIRDLPLGSIFDTITHGKNFPNMASYAAQISPDDRWRIVFYLRALMKTQDPNLPLIPQIAAAADADETQGDAAGEPAKGGAQ